MFMTTMFLNEVKTIKLNRILKTNHVIHLEGTNFDVSLHVGEHSHHSKEKNKNVAYAFVAALTEAIEDVYGKEDEE